MRANQTLFPALLSALLCALLLAAPLAQAADTLRLSGYWQLNFEETDKVSVKYDEGSGVGRSKMLDNVTVSVGGLPLPSLSTRMPPQSGMAPKDPEVLVCTAMSIKVDGNKLRLDYDQGNNETLVKGDYRGRTSKWSRDRIQQKYKTTDRTVTKTWEMRDDGRLEVAVKINPRGDKSRTYKRVFDRVENPSAG